MKKDDFFSQYQYDHELDARLKNRQERMWYYWKKVLIFSVAAFVIPLFFGKIDLSAIIFLPFNTKKNDLDTNNVRKILLRSGIVKSSITYIKILYYSKKTFRSECGWNIILEITPADVEFQKLTLLDTEAGKLFIDWLKTEEEFSKNLSLTHLKSIKVYRPGGTDGIGFPAILCNDQKCIVLLYNSKP